MTRELRDAIQEWNSSDSLQPEWDAIVNHRAFKKAVKIINLLMDEREKQLDIGIHSAVSERTLFGIREARRQLESLESLADKKPEPPKPLPPPWSEYETEPTQQTP